jgi:tetratricopeptide (TPR) repeat protein
MRSKVASAKRGARAADSCNSAAFARVSCVEYDDRVLVLVYLALALKLWMLLDAIRRRVHVLWYLVLTVPFGEVIYFFTIKLRDFNVHPQPQENEPPAEPPRPSAAAIEREAELSPSFKNRVCAGWALLEEREPERAQRYFELARRTHGRDKEAQHGLGLCQLERGDTAGAIETLSQLIDRGLAYENYGAALALAEALFRSARFDELFELLTAMIRDSRRLEHRVMLARYQLRAERKSEARDTLQGALAEFESQPELERRRDGAVATEARRLLRTLAPEEPRL